MQYEKQLLSVARPIHRPTILASFTAEPCVEARCFSSASCSGLSCCTLLFASTSPSSVVTFRACNQVVCLSPYCGSLFAFICFSTDKGSGLNCNTLPLASTSLWQCGHVEGRMRFHSVRHSTAHGAVARPVSGTRTSFPKKPGVLLGLQLPLCSVAPGFNRTWNISPAPSASLAVMMGVCTYRKPSSCGCRTQVWAHF